MKPFYPLKFILCSFLLFTLALSLTTSALAQGNVIRVDSATGNDSASCGSALAPCKTIQQAVTRAQSGDTIRLAQGTYTGSGKAVVNLNFPLGTPAKSLTFSGGYTSANWDTPNMDATKTVIDGEKSRHGSYILTVEEINVAFQGLTIQNGLVNSATDPFGGGVFCKNDNPNDPKKINLTFSNVVFRNNVAQGGDIDHNAAGGGIALFLRCPAILQDVIFDGNQVIGADSTPRGTQALGGGLFATQFSHVTAKNVTFTGNKAVAGSGGIGYKGTNIFDRADGLGGAAAFSLNTEIKLENVTATDNQTMAGSGSEYGGFANAGAFFFEKSMGTISGATLQNNMVTGGNSSAGEGGVGGGGAIMTTESTVTMNRIVFIGNKGVGGDGAKASSAGGGALYVGTSTIKGNNLIFGNNSASAGNGNKSGGGGAIFNIDSQVTLNHVTFAQNSVQKELFGSAIVTLNTGGSSSTTISYSIIANHADTDIFNNPKGALCTIAGGTSSTTLNTTLFADNGKNYDTTFNCAGTLKDNNPLTGNPQFVDVTAFDYHINPDSEAVDKATGSSIQDDVDGENRPNGAAADLGADEYQVAEANLTTSKKTFSPAVINSTGNKVQYTITLANTGRVTADNVTLTDELPTPTDPITAEVLDNATCSSGNCSFNGNTLTWTGSIPANSQVTINYGARFNIPSGFTQAVSIANTSASLNYNGGTPLSLTPTGTLKVGVVINVYLPMLIKQ